MEPVDVLTFSLELLIPSVFSMLFRAIGLGHRGRVRVTLGFGAFILYLLIIPSVLTNSMGYEEYTHIASLVMTVGSAAVLIFSSDGPVKTIFLHLTQANMAVAVSALCNMVRTVLGLSDPALLLMLLLASAFMLWVALRFWVQPLRFMVDAIQSSWKTLIEIPAITLALVMILPTYPARRFEFHPIYYTAIMLGIQLCLFLSAYASYQNLRKIKGLSEVAYRQKMLDKSMDAMRAELALREEIFLNTRITRNDLRHHNAQTLAYLENGDTEGATSYLKTHDSHISEPTLRQYCQNPVANAMLHMYVRMVRAEGISCTVETVIPESLPFSEQEICILFGNLLQNAIESCRRTEKGISRILTVSAQVDDIHLLLEIKNTAIGTVRFNEHGLPLSDRPGGGIGTRSVAEMIKKHGDMVRFQQMYGIFTVQLMIHL